MKKKYISKVKEIFSPYKSKVGLVFILLVFTTIINFITPILIQFIIDKGFGLRNFSNIISNALILFIIYNIEKIIIYLVEHIRLFIYKDIKYILYNNYYNKLNRININYFNNKSETEIFSNLDMDIENIGKLADKNSFFLLTQIFSILGGVVGLFYINYKLAILVIIAVPLKICSSKIFSSKFRKNMEEFMEDKSDVSRLFSENIYMIKEIRIFSLFNYSNEKLKKHISNYLNSNNNLSKINTLNLITEQLIFQILVLTVYVVGGYLFMKDEVTLGSIIAFISYCGMVIVPINGVLNVAYMMSGIIPSLDRYYGFIDNEKEEFNEGNLCLNTTDSNNYSISFNDVSFSYNDTEFINKLNFDINTGEKIAIVGMNGSGKSTIFNLLLRFYKVDNGRIALNNKNIYKYDIEEYRKLFSVVIQDVRLFSDNIKNNIILNNDFDDIRYNDIISKCGLYEICNNADLVKSNNVQTLSGGQKQKVSIARALYSNRPILLFDESTSNLDNKSEYDLFELFQTELKDKTVLSITHNLTLLDKMDKIIYIDNGRIVNIGSHEKMLNDASYRNYVFQNNESR